MIGSSNVVMLDHVEAPPIVTDHVQPLLTVVVPVFNEAATVSAVVERLCAVELPVMREIIVVNDGSRDGTRAALDALGPLPAVSVIHAPANKGKGSAVRQGLARARGSIVAIQDADLELDPSQLAELVRPILRGETNVVYGSRFLTGRPAAPWTTTFANASLTAFTNLLYGAALTDMETCYKVMRTDVARKLQLCADRFDIEPEITAKLLRSGEHIMEVPVRFQPRARSAGKKIGWQDGLHAIVTLVRHRLGGWSP